MSNKLAVITVNYKNYSVTHAFLKSFKKQHNQNFKIFIIDLSPEPEELTEDSLSVDVIRAENKGYAYGLNVGVHNAIEQDFTHFVCMNNDTEVPEDFVDQALRSIHEHPLSLIGGKIYYYPGYEYHKQRYSKEDLGKVLWYAGGIIDWKNIFTIHRGVDEVDKGIYDSFEETDFITGCLMMFDKTFYETVGDIDESYFMYFEDSDWSLRAARAGVKLYYDPKVILWHKNAQSSNGPGSVLHQKYQRKNRVKFALKYAPIKSRIHVLKNYLIGR
jgi:GT2 family glycosyltransferase